jgi:thiamine kinase-like enzyme
MTQPLPAILARIPALANAADVSLELIGGLTNSNYLVTADSERYVLRVSGGNTSLLGIDRAREHESLLTAAQAGIGPELVDFVMPEGHLLTRFIEGRHPSVEEYREPQMLARVVETVRRLHDLPPVPYTFSPFERVAAFKRSAGALGARFPQDCERFADHARAIRARQLADTSPWRKFCHNDLFSVNFLVNGEVRIIDWEFAGMGDLYYDLACLAYAHDDVGLLPGELIDYLLACYFGGVRDQHCSRLNDMIDMLMLFGAMWGLLQHGAQQAGLMPVVEGFDYREYAESMFEVLRGRM